MSFRFVPDPKAGQELKVAPDTGRYLLAVATLGAAAARAAFEAQGPHPYSDDPEHYVDMIEPYAGFERGSLFGRVNAHASYSWFIEVGTSDTPTFAPLQKGMDAIGLRTGPGLRHG